MIDCELCHQCFALPCECVQMDIMMTVGKGELKHWKYLMKEQKMCKIKCIDKTWHIIINDVSVYSSCVSFSLNFLKKWRSKNGKNEIFHIRRWNINKYEKMRKITNMQA